MNKLKTFLNAFVKTFTSPDYYGDILAAPFKFSLKFFFFYFFLYSFISTSILTISTFIPLQKGLMLAVPRLSEIVPEELEINIKDGNVTTNVQEPYYVPIDTVENLFKNINRNVLGAASNKPRYLLVIDTNAKIEDFTTYQTEFLLTKNFLTYYKDNRIEVAPLSQIKNATISRATLDVLLKNLIPYTQYVATVLMSATFIFTLIFLPLAKFYYSLFLAFVLYILTKFFNLTLTYKKLLQISLHLVVVSTTLFSLLSLTPIKLSFPFLQTILLSIAGVFILNKIKRLKSQTP